MGGRWKVRKLHGDWWATDPDCRNVLYPHEGCRCSLFLYHASAIRHADHHAHGRGSSFYFDPLAVSR